MNEVELFHAWSWICDTCGITNYTSCITLSLEEAVEIGAISQEEADESEGLIVYSEPEEVTCSMCKVKYKTAL